MVMHHQARTDWRPTMGQRWYLLNLPSAAEGIWLEQLSMAMRSRGQSLDVQSHELSFSTSIDRRWSGIVLHCTEHSALVSCDWLRSLQRSNPLGVVVAWCPKLSAERLTVWLELGVQVWARTAADVRKMVPKMASQAQSFALELTPAFQDLQKIEPLHTIVHLSADVR